jgi:hypothetical protein
MIRRNTSEWGAVQRVQNSMSSEDWNSLCQGKAEMLDWDTSWVRVELLNKAMEVVK